MNRYEEHEKEESFREFIERYCGTSIHYLRGRQLEVADRAAELRRSQESDADEVLEDLPW